MNYQRRRRLYSQNFLRSPELLNKLIRKSSIGKNDIVLEIGSGKGVITSELLKVSRKVIAIEIDDKFCSYLTKKFQMVDNLELYNADFLKFGLPKHPFKVFANIPFIITADIIRKLTCEDNFREGFLVVQKEAAQKIIGIPYDNRNQMMSVLLKPWFDIKIHHEFSRNDFYPVIGIDSTMIRISRLKNPLVDYSKRNIYRDFILYSYNRRKIAKLSFKKIFKQFEDFLKNSSLARKRFIEKEAGKIIKQQNNLQIIHRTRNDRNWRKFKNY